MRLLHREESRPELFIVHRAQILQLSGEFSKILVSQCILCTYPLIWIVSQQLVEYISHVLSTSIRQKLLYSNALLRGEVYLHVSCLALKSVEYFLPWCAQYVINPMYLIQLIFPRKQWFFSDQLEQYAAEAPDVHLLVIIAICHETLWCSVPSGGDVVCVGERGVFALAGAEICEFDEIAFDEYVFRFNVPVEDALAMHKLDCAQYLEHIELNFLEGKRVFLIFQALIHIHVHEFEDECELAYLGGCVPLGSSQRASIILIIFSWGERMFRAWISLSFFTFYSESNFFFMHLIATYLPVLSESAVNTTEKVPLPFSNYSLYWSMLYKQKYNATAHNIFIAIINHLTCQHTDLPKLKRSAIQKHRVQRIAQYKKYTDQCHSFCFLSYLVCLFLTKLYINFWIQLIVKPFPPSISCFISLVFLNLVEKVIYSLNLLGFYSYKVKFSYSLSSM